MNMTIDKPIRLEINESDVDEAEKNKLKKELLATRTLGEKEQIDRKILDLLPKVIAERLKQVIPADFEISELEFKFEVEGKLFGSGIGGEVVARLRKRPTTQSGD
jgi:hypothetical protein